MDAAMLGSGKKQLCKLFLALFLAAVILGLPACQTLPALNMPEIKELKKEIRQAYPDVYRVKAYYGSKSGGVFITVYVDELPEKDIFKIVYMVQQLFIQPEFQEALFDKVEAASSPPDVDLKVKLLYNTYSFSSYYFRDISFTSRTWRTDPGDQEIIGYSIWYGSILTVPSTAGPSIPISWDRILEEATS